ncbi:MAG: pyridoxamine 5'-phosphate oxidase family protein [Clostridiaceae bacterium]|nr:pyridoxamine 5'-phosphate oxidase family protein [Clostridiaceae bacterium]
MRDSDVKDKVLKALAEKKMCYIATAGENNVDNAVVAYYADGFDLYFGSFSDTLKCRNLRANSKRET